MPIDFDIISDLNLDNLDDFSWENKATSLCCIIAGNISSNRAVLIEFLDYMSKFYEKVFFIDGKLDHEEFGGDFHASYESLTNEIADLDDVVFMHENIILIHGVTLIGTNGWSTLNFTGQNNITDTIEFLDLRGIMTDDIAKKTLSQAIMDQRYLVNSIDACQTMSDSQNIIIVTNTVPLKQFVSSDHNYNGTIDGDIAGNDEITECVNYDSEEKITSWVFGTYEGYVDEDISGIRFLNNSRGNKDFDIYYPKLLKFN